MSFLSRAVKNIAKQTGRSVQDVVDELKRAPHNVERILRLGGVAAAGGVGGLVASRIPDLLDEAGGDLESYGPVVPADAPTGPACVDSLGRPLAKIRPWVITSTFRIAAGALTADASQGDFFNSANSAFFTTTGRFPNPFTNRWVSGMMTVQAPAAVTETPGSSIGGAYVVLINQVELARYAYIGPNGFGGKMTVVSPTIGTSGTGAAADIEPARPVSWPWFFDSNSTWAEQLRVPDGITTVNPIDANIAHAGFLHNTG